MIDLRDSWGNMGNPAQGCPLSEGFDNRSAYAEAMVQPEGKGTNAKHRPKRLRIFANRKGSFVSFVARLPPR